LHLFQDSDFGQRLQAAQDGHRQGPEINLHPYSLDQNSANNAHRLCANLRVLLDRFDGLGLPRADLSRSRFGLGASAKLKKIRAILFVCWRHLAGRIEIWVKIFLGRIIPGAKYGTSNASSE
jgi:hypothetical protein